MITTFRGRYWFLSNFYPCEIEFQGITYNSVETYYVAMKIKNDQTINGRYYTAADLKEYISKLEPGLAKKIGQMIKVRSDWEEKRLEFMEYGIREKFKNELLKEMLIATGTDEIIEGNYWHDCWWGQCTCDKCSGKGKNNLGKLLMKLRSEFNGTQKRGLEQLF